MPSSVCSDTESESRKSIHRSCKTSSPRYRREQLTLAYLPTEVLIKIFSYLSVPDLIFNVRLVCRRFCWLSMAPPLWETVVVPPDLPHPVLKKCLIQHGERVRHLHTYGCKDGDELFKNVARFCKQLESISAENIFGTPTKSLVHARPLCNVLLRCRHLTSVRLSSCKFTSRRFFRLLVRPSGKACQRKRLQYRGPVTRIQMTEMIRALQNLKNDSQVYVKDGCWMLDTSYLRVV